MHPQLILAGLIASTAAQQQSCPTTTVQDHGGCKGCTTAIPAHTSSESINCGECTSIATVTDSTPYLRCNYVCVGGIKTVSDEQGTATVTACSTQAMMPKN